jgi:transcriptional regulator with XRE-family HTH domain
MKDLVKISEVMEEFMKSYGLTQDKFAAALNSGLGNTDVSRVAVTNWCNDKSSPSTDFLLVCAAVYEDWRRSWAMACLKVKLPEVFDSGIIVFKLPIKD